MLSIIIPSRVDEFLQKTIDGLLENAEGEVEIIVVLDGYNPTVPVNTHPKVRVIHHGTPHDSFGMRHSINLGMSLARGKYVMKIDEHCVVDKGYDVKLAADCEDNWVVTPRRYRLEPTLWCILKDRRPPVDYNFIAYPYARIHDNACGVHGEMWNRPERADVLIDDTITHQGSCYFTTREWWFKTIGPLNEEQYGPFTHEAQEVTLKSVFAGGRSIVNKKTWYAHMHKGHRGKGYGFSNKQYEWHRIEKEKGRLFAIDYWMYTKDFKRTFDDVYAEFGPWPGWPENWRERLITDKILEHTPPA